MRPSRPRRDTLPVRPAPLRELRHIPILQFAQYSFSASPFINESSVGQPVLSVDEGPHPKNEIAKIGKIKQFNPNLLAKK